MQMRWFWILWLHAFWVKQMEMMMASRQVQQGFAINIISWLTWLLQCEANNMVPTIARRHIFLLLDCIVTDKCKLMCMNDEGFHSFLFGTRCRRRRLFQCCNFLCCFCQRRHCCCCCCCCRRFLHLILTETFSSSSSFFLHLNTANAKWKQWLYCYSLVKSENYLLFTIILVFLTRIFLPANLLRWKILQLTLKQNRDRE